MKERIQKLIAKAGISSRRAAEELLLSGRVRVNGRVVTELGTKADPHEDKVEVDGKRLVSQAPVYVLLHKPRGVVSTLSDPEGRPTVAEILRALPVRVYPVGRLDFATSGVLLATNDGDFAQGLLHPKGGVPKTYVVKVQGLLSDDELDMWRKGVRLEDGMTLPAHVLFLRHEEDKTWFEISLREGRNQQIRRMGEATGHPVMRLARTSFAGIGHEGLRPGEWRYLTTDELRELRKQFGVPKKVRSSPSETPAQSAHRRPSGHRAGAGREGERRPSREPGREGERRGRPDSEQGPRSPAAPMPARAKSERSGRFEKTPREAAPPGFRARGRGGR